jgi:hypothetical protein
VSEREPSSEKKRLSREKPASEATEKATNIQANAKATDGYFLSIDGKLKPRYESYEDGSVAAANLKRRFPMIQLLVYDSAAGTYNPVDAIARVIEATFPGRNPSRVTKSFSESFGNYDRAIAALSLVTRVMHPI